MIIMENKFCGERGMLLFYVFILSLVELHNILQYFTDHKLNLFIFTYFSRDLTIPDVIKCTLLHTVCVNRQSEANTCSWSAVKCTLNKSRIVKWKKVEICIEKMKFQAYKWNYYICPGYMCVIGKKWVVLQLGNWLKDHKNQNVAK
jgi:hypothetical protein